MMCNRLAKLLGVFMMLCFLAGHANADLVGNWTFDDGAGSTAIDKSGNGNNGVLMGGPTWIAGTLGGALSFDGADDTVEVPHHPVFDMGESITVAAWINLDNATNYYFIAAKGPSGTAGDNYPGNFEFRTTPSAQLELMHQTGEGAVFTSYISDSTVTAGQWVHVAATLVEGGAVEFYIDGQPAGSAAQSGEFGILNEEPIRIATRKDNYSFMGGAIDDLQIYNHALTAEDIQTAMNGLAFEQAAVDSPEDGAVDVLRHVGLTWTPGMFAGTHDLYVGDSFEAVDAATVPTVSGLTDPSHDLGRLDFGKTVFWRVDEV
ncbi:MAG: LamG domain-containing protein, partial [Planctomycetes bacterium]|nr:LamG domain-containing protein [Planctomycetota bacterium]